MARKILLVFVAVFFSQNLHVQALMAVLLVVAASLVHTTLQVRTLCISLDFVCRLEFGVVLVAELTVRAFPYPLPAVRTEGHGLHGAGLFSGKFCHLLCR